MTVEFVAKSMSEAIRAIADLRAELEIAYEHLHAAEAERDALRDEVEQWREFSIRLADVPAVRIALGENHTEGCHCSLCRIDAARGKR